MYITKKVLFLPKSLHVKLFLYVISMHISLCEVDLQFAQNMRRKQPLEARPLCATFYGSRDKTKQDKFYLVAQ